MSTKDTTHTEFDPSRLWTVTLPAYNYALEWDISEDRPEFIPVHQRREFADREAFDKYEGEIREAEKEGMCTNVKVFVRKVEVSPWIEGLVAP
jgi:hypothetical protein